MVEKKKIINDIVIISNNILVRKPKLEDAKIVGIIIKIIKGFTIPPVK